jgi:hypothetical protein
VRPFFYLFHTGIELTLQEAINPHHPVARAPVGCSRLSYFSIARAISCSYFCCIAVPRQSCICVGHVHSTAGVLQSEQSPFHG